jgi:hypothetical protein
MAAGGQQDDDDQPTGAGGEMTVSFLTRHREIDLGGTFRVMQAFYEMERLIDVADYPQLMYVPSAADEVWPDDMAAKVRAQAGDMLARHGEALSQIARDILEDLIRSGDPG